MTGFVTQIGEAFVGIRSRGRPPQHRARRQGRSGRDGLGHRPGHPPCRARRLPDHGAPGVPAKPMTLFVNKATLEGGAHSTMTWGPAQAGVASGVLWAVADGIVPADLVDDLVLIAAVWVNPAAADEALVYDNNRTATRDALAAGAGATAHAGRGPRVPGPGAQRLLPATRGDLSPDARVPGRAHVDAAERACDDAPGPTPRSIGAPPCPASKADTPSSPEPPAGSASRPPDCSWPRGRRWSWPTSTTSGARPSPRSWATAPATCTWTWPRRVPSSSAIDGVGVGLRRSRLRVQQRRQSRLARPGRGDRHGAVRPDGRPSTCGVCSWASGPPPGSCGPRATAASSTRPAWPGCRPTTAGTTTALPRRPSPT